MVRDVVFACARTVSGSVRNSGGERVGFATLLEAQEPVITTYFEMGLQGRFEAGPCAAIPPSPPIPEQEQVRG